MADHMDRNSKIRFIAQSHLEPGMTLWKLEQIFDEYQLEELKDWDKLSDEELDEIIQRIKGEAKSKSSFNEPNQSIGKSSGQ